MGSSISVSVPLLLFAAILQASVLPQFRILGGAPDLVFLLVLTWATHSDLDEAIAWAFIGGIAQDLLSAAPTGSSVLGMILMVFVVYLLNRQLYRTGIFMLLLLTFSGTFVKELLSAIAMTAAGFSTDLLLSLEYVILPSAIYNTALVLFVYAFVRFLQRRLQRDPRVFR